MLCAISLVWAFLATAPAPAPAMPAVKTVQEVLSSVSVKADDYGELIYRGSAWPLHGARVQPRFVYERRVSGRRSASVASDQVGVVLID